MKILFQHLKRVSIILGLTSFTCISSACATSNCVYDNDYYKPSRYTNNQLVEQVKYVKADHSAKIITHKGDLISIKHWSCDHHGLHAVMLVGPYPADDSFNIKKQIQILSTIALDKDEAQLLNDFILNKEIALEAVPVKLNISSEEYDEFYIGYSEVNDSIIIEIKFYKS